MTNICAPKDYWFDRAEDPTLMTDDEIAQEIARDQWEAEVEAATEEEQAKIDSQIELCNCGLDVSELNGWMWVGNRWAPPEEMEEFFTYVDVQNARELLRSEVDRAIHVLKAVGYPLLSI